MDPTSIRLTNTQKEALVRAFAAISPQAAHNDVMQSENSIEAIEMLVKIGAVNASTDQLEVTDLGKQLMVNSNLIDDMGEVTDEGNSFLFADSKPDQGPVQTPESFELLKAINDQTKFR